MQGILQAVQQQPQQNLQARVVLLSVVLAVQNTRLSCNALPEAY